MASQPFKAFVGLPDAVPLHAFTDLRKRVGHVEYADGHDPRKIVGMAAVHGCNALGSNDALRDRCKSRHAHIDFADYPNLFNKRL